MGHVVIPSAASLPALLKGKRRGELLNLARLTGIPFGTLVHVARGKTKNPGIETVRKLWGFLPGTEGYVIPSAESLRARLRDMDNKALAALARESGVPFGTLMNIRIGHTENPSVETCRKFSPFLGKLEG